MQAVDIFSGAGGMSVGAALAGIEVKYAIESDPRPQRIELTILKR
jgi:DNA (cytosine-5)-methyltransferase 1